MLISGRTYSALKRVIRVGDEVEILTRGPARACTVRSQEEEMVDVETQASSAVDIHWQGQVIRGNNQQVLLEQLEQAGIRIPYSCRAGSVVAVASSWSGATSVR